MTTIKLKDCANIKTGKLNSNAAVIGGIYPFFTCDPETSQIDYFSFDEEAILLAGNNASGKFNIKYYVGKFNAYQRTYIINSSTDTLKTKYLYYFLSTKLPQFTTLSSGSATKFLTKALLDNCDIEVPSLDEQSHIVDILGSIDDSIENNEKIIEALEEKMLLEYDHLIASATLTGSEMQEIFDISIGKTPPRKESHWFTENPKDVKWLSISDMGKAKVFAFDSSEKITAEGIEKYNVKIAPENTVLLSFKLTIGKVAITGCEMATNEAIAHFVSNDENIVEYLYCYLKRYNFDMLGNTSSIATAVNSKTIKAMKFYYPDTETLAYFHRIAEPLIKKIKHLLITNAKLNELKQLYLKKFFG